MTPEHRVWFLLGSNIEPELHLMESVRLLTSRFAILSVSSVWQSPPADGSDQPDYLNAALLAATGYSPEEILTGILPEIETALGRVRSEDAYAPRTIDVDLMLYDSRKGIFAGKPLPHPDITRQVFAAVPLAEISPEKRHPASGETLQAIAVRLEKQRIFRRDDLMLWDNPQTNPPD